MGRSDKVDVVTTHILELQHHPGQPFGGDLTAFAEMADRIVLAEPAAQVAVGEEDRARSVLADQWPFLAEVGRVGRHRGKEAGSAGSFFSLEAVDPAEAGTQGAALKKRQRLFDPLPE
jgi:hypothetical protein